MKREYVCSSRKVTPAPLTTIDHFPFFPPSYKIIAGMVARHLVLALDRCLMDSQYSFRPKRSTSQPLHTARRLLEYAYAKGTTFFLLLLDWEKAFDKVSHEA